MFSSGKSYFVEFKLIKLKMITIASKTNNETGKPNWNREAARLFEVDKSMVKKWKKYKNNLTLTNRSVSFWKSKMD